MRFVVDSSVALKWFVEEPGYEAAKSILDANELLFAPDLVIVEVTNSLWRKVRSGEIGVDLVQAAIEEMHSFFKLSSPNIELMTVAFDMARRLAHSVYDCVFLAHAVLLNDAVLITADNKFAEKAATAGFADWIRTLDAAPVRMTFSNEMLENLLSLHQTSKQTLENVSRLLLGQQPTRAIRIISTSELVPAFESPSYVRLKKEIERLVPHQAAALIATCWLGRGYDGSDFKRLYSQAQHLSEAPAAHSPYIISLLGYLEAGIAQSRGG